MTKPKTKPEPKPETKPIRIAIARIRTDGGTQSREQVDADTVAEYKAAYASSNASTMPPVVVFYDGKTYWLADGFHRVAGARGAGLTAIATDVKQGTQRDAVLYSVGANTTHGLRRSNADKRRAVMLLLGDAEWTKKSDRWIAEACAVTQPFVSGLRRSTDNGSQLPPPKRTGKDGKTRKLPTTKPASKPGTVTSGPTLSLAQWKTAQGVVSLGGDAIADCDGVYDDDGCWARQVELPTTARVRVEPQPERAPLVVAVRTCSPDVKAEDDGNEYDPPPKGVVLAQVYRYILTVADEWNSEWNFRDLTNQVASALRYIEHRHEERNTGNG